MPRWLQPRSHNSLVLFVALGVSSVAFAFLTFELFTLAMKNAAFLGRYGLMAVMEGGLLQTLEIAVKGALALLLYLVFRGIEGELVRRWFGRG